MKAYLPQVKSVIAKRREFFEQNPGLHFLDQPIEQTYEQHGEFVASMAQGFKTFGKLTDPQVLALRRTLGKAQEIPKKEPQKPRIQKTTLAGVLTTKV